MDFLLIVYAIAGLPALYILTSYFYPSQRSLSHIPTVGGPSLPILSWIGAVRFLFHGPEFLAQGYAKHKDGLFKHAEGGKSWRVIICSSTLIEEMRRVPEDHLSFRAATSEAIQVKYTLGLELFRNPYHVQTVRAKLTTNEALSRLFSDIYDEVIHAFQAVVPATDEWTHVTALPSMTDIVCRISGRVFVGLPLCRNEDYCALNKRFTMDVFIGGLIISLFPDILKPIAGRLLTNVPHSIRRGEKHLRAIIEGRLAHEPGEEWDGKPNDMLQWLVDAAQGEERGVHRLVMRMLMVNLASTHSTSITFTQALLLLAVHPEHLSALREEVESIVYEEGWTKAAINRMRRVDSFLKETQRFVGVSGISMVRKAVQDFTFSDGTFIPAGTFIAVPSHSLHHNDQIYKNPQVFDPFRFTSTCDDNGEGVRSQMVSTSTDYLPFGHGRHACPGRFLVATELKTMLAHVVVTYDVKLERAGEPSLGRWIGASLLPDEKAEVLFRRRRD